MGHYYQFSYSLLISLVPDAVEIGEAVFEGGGRGRGLLTEIRY